MQALDAVVKALACNPSNIEMQRKARDLRKKIGGGSTSLTKADKENDGRQQSIKDTEAASQAQRQQPLKVCSMHKSILLNLPCLCGPGLSRPHTRAVMTAVFQQDPP